MNTNKQTHKCNTCFYRDIQDSVVAPCRGCSGYDKYIQHELYFWDKHKDQEQASQKDTDKYVQATSIMTFEDYLKIEEDLNDGPVYDFVEKPKHYMLFEEQGIEVRDVIQKLTEKLDACTELKSYAPAYSGMFVADYVQMMQYLMRFMDKNGLEDLKKARWYLDKLIESHEPDDF